MPDHYGFNHLTNWGRVTVECIECGLQGRLSEWPEERRKDHCESFHSVRIERKKRNRRTKDEMEAVRLEQRERQKEKQRLREEKEAAKNWTINSEGLRVQNCKLCGVSFTQERRRGRPQVECEDCRGW